jgi:MinD superfamily P-loop ATPase
LAKALVVISGKGGTGKTSLLACFAALAEDKVIADCDVDAADLHLILDPDTIERHSFTGGKKAQIDTQVCTECGECFLACRFDAIEKKNGSFVIDPVACEGCSVCSYVCPEGAIALRDEINGDWFVSETRHGPLVHAKLAPGGENSGKLVTTVRTAAQRIAHERGLSLVLIDGSPGIGCPVIASISGASLVLAVTEPTLSGQHDLGRIFDLAAHFRIRVLTCINKSDVNPEIAREIEKESRSRGADLVGAIPYDPAFTKAQIEKKTLVEFSQGPSSQCVRDIWESVKRALS